MNRATSYRVPATRPRAREWLDTSIAAAVTPRSTATASSACRSGASGVVRAEATRSAPIRISTPPISAVVCPAARRPASIR